MEPDVSTSKILSHVTIVTDEVRGIGRAMVPGFAGTGIHVIATAAREPSEIEAVAEEVRQSTRVLPLVADFRIVIPPCWIPALIACRQLPPDR